MPPWDEQTKDKSLLMRNLEKELSRYPQISIIRYNENILEITGVLASAQWGVGKKMVDYSACLNVNEVERTVVFCENIKEKCPGPGYLAGVKNIKVKKIDYILDCAHTRKLVERVVRSNGWKFKMFLLKSNTLLP